ncbi:MAG: HAD family hydrolase, partial [Candidatus Dormibacteria bacterium]
ENDLALLDAAGVGVAVENAVDALKQHADIVLVRPAADGITELCESLVRDDLADLLETSTAGA